MDRPIIFPALALLFLAIIGWHILDQVTFAWRAPTTFTNGTITNVTVDYDDLCHTLVRFPTGPDTSENFSAPLTSWSSSLEIGPFETSSVQCNGHISETVSVAYHPSDPKNARLVPPGGFWLGNWPLFVAFLLIFLIGGSLVIPFQGKGGKKAGLNLQGQEDKKRLSQR